MVTTPLLLNAPRSIGEKRVIFHNLNWQAYQQIVRAIGESRSTHFTYDRGTLEMWKLARLFCKFLKQNSMSFWPKRRKMRSALNKVYDNGYVNKYE